MPHKCWRSKHWHACAAISPRHTGFAHFLFSDFRYFYLSFQRAFHLSLTVLVAISLEPMCSLRRSLPPTFRSTPKERECAPCTVGCRRQTGPSLSSMVVSKRRTAAPRLVALPETPGQVLRSQRLSILQEANIFCLFVLMLPS